MTLNDWVAVGSTGIAVVSLAINVVIVRRQSMVQVEALRAQADAELFAWTSEAIDAFADAIATAKGLGKAWTGEEAGRRIALAAAHLSGIADKGRMFFPNIEDPTHGQDKPEAFRGRRQLVLDALVFAHHMTDRLDADGAADIAAARYLFDCRRMFIDEVQRALDPRRRQRVFERLKVRGRSSAWAATPEVKRLFEALVARHPDLAAEGVK